METSDTDLRSGNVDTDERLAPRSKLVIDLDEGTVAAGSWSTTFDRDPGDPDDVLARYLSLLYVMRGLEPGTPIPLRSVDLSVLSEALALPPDDVEHRLVVLMEPGNELVGRIRSLLSRRALLGVAGLVVVACTTAGVLVFTPSTSPAEEGGTLELQAPPQVAPPGADDAEIGEGLTIERSDFDQ